MWVKGGGSTVFEPKNLNTVGGDQNHWQQYSPHWHGSGNQIPYVCGWWMRPWPGQGSGATASAPMPIVSQDFDSNLPNGYRRQYVSFKDLASESPTISIYNYSTGTSNHLSFFLPEIKDPDQWFFFMGYIVDNKTFGWIVNGHPVGTIYNSSQDGPYPNSANGSLSRLWTRRYAGGNDLSQSSAHRFYNYFIMALDDYTNPNYTSGAEWEKRGVVKDDMSTWANPWVETSNNMYISPITEEEDPERRDLVASTSRGMGFTVQQDRNDIIHKASNQYSEVYLPSGNVGGAYERLPVYGYDLRELI